MSSTCGNDIQAIICMMQCMEVFRSTFDVIGSDIQLCLSLVAVLLSGSIKFHSVPVMDLCFFIQVINIRQIQMHKCRN